MPVPTCSLLIFAFVVATVGLRTGSALAYDESGAESLMRKSGCFKCHSVSKRKDGPSYQEIAIKFKNKPDGEKKLFTHITAAPVVRIDGDDEDHIQIKSKDPAEIKNVVTWILTR